MKIIKNEANINNSLRLTSSNKYNDSALAWKKIRAETTKDNIITSNNIFLNKTKAELTEYFTICSGINLKIDVFVPNKLGISAIEIKVLSNA